MTRTLLLYGLPPLAAIGDPTWALRPRSDSIWPGYAVGIAGLAGVALGLA